MPWLRSIILPLALCTLLPALLAAAPAPPPAAAVQADLESVVLAAYSPDAPGAAVIVVQDGKILYRGARGLANVELGVPLRPETVFRIGSVTKQFTAAAILLLAEQGKLSLSDPITKFLTDYPVQGHLVTIQHLLSHTSGIRNYIELPEWQASIRNDVSVQQLMGFFKDKPFDFAPGELQLRIRAKVRAARGGSVACAVWELTIVPASGFCTSSVRSFIGFSLRAGPRGQCLRGRTYPALAPQSRHADCEPGHPRCCCPRRSPQPPDTMTESWPPARPC
jgi:Beta-lactamase